MATQKTAAGVAGAESAAATKAGWLGPAAGIGVPLAVAGLMALPGKYVKSLRRKSEAEAKAIAKAPTVSTPEISAATAAGEAAYNRVMSEAKRGSAGGAAGMDVEREQMANRARQEAYSQELSRGTKAALERIGQRLKVWQKGRAYLSQEAQDRRDQLFGTIGGVAQSKAMEKVSTQLGQAKRAKTTEEFKQGRLDRQGQRVGQEVKSLGQRVQDRQQRLLQGRTGLASAEDFGNRTKAMQDRIDLMNQGSN
tara:strand:+ start:373 stop:1128 length:756 start_codon:yes stop_codon:yes gene_type:complete